MYYVCSLNVKSMHNLKNLRHICLPLHILITSLDLNSSITSHNHCLRFIGLNTGFAPLYLTEVSPVNLRGSIGSIHQLQVTVAILVSQILGLPYIFGTEKLWPLIFAFTIVPVIVQLAVLPFCPESPKFTLINRGNVNQAERDLKKLRGSEV